MPGSEAGSSRFDSWSYHVSEFRNFFLLREGIANCRDLWFSLFFHLFAFCFDQNSGRCTFLLKSVARGRGRSRASRSPPHPLKFGRLGFGQGFENARINYRVGSKLIRKIKIRIYDIFFEKTMVFWFFILKRKINGKIFRHLRRQGFS